MIAGPGGLHSPVRFNRETAQNAGEFTRWPAHARQRQTRTQTAAGAFESQLDFRGNPLMSSSPNHSAEPCCCFLRRQTALIPSIILARVASSAQRAFEAAAIFSRADGLIRPASTCSVISWRLAGSAHLARMAAAIPLRLSGFPTPAMSLLRSIGSAHLARIAAAIRLRHSGLLIAAMNLLRPSGSAQRALVPALFRSRLV